MKTASAKADFDQRYQTHLKHLKLKGLQPKTIDAYSRAIRRMGDYFDHQIDNLSAAQLTDYFSDLITTHSWSAVKLDLYGFKFYTQHVLGQPWAMPAAALDCDKGLWRTLRRGAKGDGYLFNHKALAKVFRGKLLAALREEGLLAPPNLPEKWVVDCKCVGSGEKVLVYLGRYLYRGVIQEKYILLCENGQVTYRWRDSKTRKMQTRTVSGAQFLWLVLQHVLPKGFRRARNYGFLHPNSKRLIALLRLLVFKPCAKAHIESAPVVQTERPKLLCHCCGAVMVIVRRRILPFITEPACADREAILSA